jgi:hypothetical protein
MTTMTNESRPEHAPRSSLPADRAFVVQFSASPVSGDGQAGGRVEHLVTGFAARFLTWGELRGFLDRVLRQADQSTVGCCHEGESR